MIRGYKKLVIFQLAILFLLILNGFVVNILDEYNIVFFLVILIILFKILFGIEREDRRYRKDILFEFIVFIVAFFIIFYFLGFFFGFARTSNYYSYNGFKNFIIPKILTIILREILRFVMLKKTYGDKRVLISTCILFIFFDITNPLYYGTFDSGYSIFLFIALTLMPSISANIAFTYLSPKTGYKPIIIYSLFIGLYNYLIPIIPNPNEYLTSIIMFILPILLAFKLSKFLNKISDEEKESRIKKSSILSLIIPSAFLIIFIYFTSGYFRYYAISIATGSMEPVILKGDVVIIEQTKENFEELEEGQVIAFEYNKVIVVHRIIRKIKEGNEYYYYTQGDANANEDGYPITKDMLVGVVSLKIPYIGLPTIWLKEL